MNRKRPDRAMSDPNLSNRLSVLAADILAAHSAIKRTTLETAERAVAAGHMLIEAKTAMPHGAWDDWLRDHAGLSARTARRYMQIARSGLETATVADLGIRGAAEQLGKSSASALAALNGDPAYLAFQDEIAGLLAAAPSQAAREQMLRIIREQAQVEDFAAWVHARLAPSALEEVCKWIERADPKQVSKLLEASLKARRTG